VKGAARMGEGGRGEEVASSKKNKLKPRVQKSIAYSVTKIAKIDTLSGSENKLESLTSKKL